MMQDHQPTVFQPDTPLEVTLQAQEWNVVLGGLYELPFRVSNQVIEKVRQQLTLSPQPQPSNGDARVIRQ